MQVDLNEIDALFHQISQNVTADCLTDCIDIFLHKFTQIGLSVEVEQSA